MASRVTNYPEARPRKAVLSLEPLEPRILLDGAAEPAGGAVQLLDAAPALFVQNQGQWADSSVYYGFQRPGASIGFTENGLVFGLSKEVSAAQEQAGLGPDNVEKLSQAPGYETATFSVHFEGANAVQPVGVDKADTVFNYFIGDQASWREDVAGYKTVAYKGLYDGIDLLTYGQGSGLKYEFDVAPGADYSQIQMSYSGTDGLFIADDGTLHVQTPLGELVDNAPDIYQEINGQRVEVTGRFVFVNSTTCGFDVTGSYNPAYALVVDPDVAWSTCLGGSGWDEGNGIAVDSSGNALVTGYTQSSHFSGSNNSYKGGDDGDAFVAKVSSDGSLEWATYLGGSSGDYGHGIAVDSSGNALVTGDTDSSDFSGSNNSYMGGDAFVAKVSSGGSLEWATYLGGSGSEYGYSIAVDSSGNALVTGHTSSSDFSGSNNSYMGGFCDAFVAKVSSGGSLLWATYLGGSNSEDGYGIAVDSSGDALVTGETDSSDFPSSNNGYNGGDYDAFVAKVSSSGSLLWATYCGGTNVEFGRAIAVDPSGNPLVAGETHSSDFAGSSNGYKGGSCDAFVAKISSSGSLLWATYCGGTNGDVGRGIAVDSSGNALVTGVTHSSDFSGIRNSFNGGSYDAFAAKVSSGGSLLWATYLGGTRSDWGEGITVDSSGDALVTGETASSDFLGSNNSFKGDSIDAFVAKIAGDSVSPTASASVGNITTGGGTTYTFTVTYSDNVAVDVSDLDGNDIVVTGPNGYSQLATFMGVDINSDGTPRVATYQINAPGGSWDFSDNGTYSVAMEANQVSDTSGNPVPAEALASFVSQMAEDSVSPTASASVGNITTGGGTTYTFTVTYWDNVAADVSGLDGNDIRVTGPNGYSQLATFMGVDINSDGTPRVATYRINAPGGSWDFADNGTYSVAMEPNQVSDTSGNSIPAGTLTTFSVALPPPQVGYWHSGNAKVWAYDTSGPVDIDPAGVHVRFGTNAAVSSITLTGTTPMEGLGIAVDGASSVGSIKDSRQGTKGALAFIAVSSSVKSIQIQGSISGYNINGATFGALTLPPDIDRDGSEADNTAILTRAVPSIKVAGAVAGDVVILGDVSGTSLKSFSAGGLQGGLLTDGSAGKVSLAGTLGGDLRIGGSLSGLQIKGGNLAGSVLVQGAAGKLSVAGMKNKQTGLTTGGDMTTGAHIYAGISLSGLSLSGSMIGGSANEADLVQICAPVISSLSVGGNITHSRILAGTDLGADWAIGGTGDDADSFAAGTIGKCKVGGDVSDSTIGAGLLPHNGMFDLQWLHDNTAFLPGSSLKSGSIGGSLTSSWVGVGQPYGVGAATLGSGKLGGTGENLVFSNGNP